MSLVEDALEAIRKHGRYGVDLETTGTNPKKDRILSVSVACGERAWCLPFVGPKAMPFRETMEALKPAFCEERLLAILQNGKFDLEFLWAAGYDIQCRMADTMLAAWLLDETLAGSAALKLQNLALVELGLQLKDYGEFSQGDDLLGGPGIETKGLQDAIATYRLWVERYEKRLKKDDRLWKFYWELAMPIVRVLAEMETAGVVIDLPWMWELRKRLEAESKEIEKKVNAQVGRPFLITSPEQVSQYLFGELGLKPKPFMELKPKNFQLKKLGPNGTVLWSSKEEVLSEYAAECPMADWVLDHRHKMKLVSTNIVPFVEIASADPENRLRTHFWQTGTESGRLSSSDPVNLQNLPRDKGMIRRGIICPADCDLIAADYSQLELRLMANASRDQKLMEAYMTGKDIHAMTQSGLKIPERVVAKQANFGLIYGMQALKLQKTLWINARVRATLNDCERWRIGFFEQYSGVPRYHEEIRKQMRENGYVRSLTGRYRRVKQFMEEDFEGAFRVAVNFTIQGSAADLTLIAMRNLQREIEKRRRVDERWNRVRQIIQVHDSIEVEAPKSISEEALELVKASMEQAVRLPSGVPLVVSIGKGANWEAAEEDAKTREKATAKVA